MVRIKVIAACSRNKTIGRDGKLPWKLLGDWSWFCTCTYDSALIIGRHSFEEFESELPDRQTYVVTNRENTAASNSVRSVRNGIEQAVEDGYKTVWIGGGRKIFEEGFLLADELYLTRIHQKIQGDVAIPAWEEHFTKLQYTSRPISQDRYSYTFEIWTK